MFPNLVTTGSQFGAPLGHKGSNQCFPILESRLPSLRTKQFPNIGTNASQSWNLGFPVLGTSSSQTLEPMLPQTWYHGFWVRGTYGSKRWNQCFRLAVPKSCNRSLPILELRVRSSRNWGSKRWNQCFPTLAPRGPRSRNFWFPKVWTNASQSWNQGFPVLGTTVFQTWEPMRPKLGLVCLQLRELLVHKDWNQYFPSLEL
jgi:hypothetical protein